MSPTTPNNAANLHIVESDDESVYSNQEIMEAAEALSKKRGGTPSAQKIFDLAQQSDQLMRALKELADVEREKKARQQSEAEKDLLAELIYDAGDLADEAEAAMSVDEDITLAELHKKVQSEVKIHVIVDRFMREFKSVGRTGAVYALVAIRGIAIYLQKGWNEWRQDPRTPDERREVCEQKLAGFGLILDSVKTLLAELGLDTSSSDGYELLKRYFDTSDRTRSAIIEWAQGAGYGHTFLKPYDFFNAERNRNQVEDDQPRQQADPELVSELVTLFLSGGSDDETAGKIARSIAKPGKSWRDGITPIEMIAETALFKGKMMYKAGDHDHDILEATRHHRDAVGITEMDFLGEVRQQSRPTTSVMQFQGGEPTSSPRRGRTSQQAAKAAKSAADREMRAKMRGSSNGGGGKKGGNAKKRK